MGITLITGPRRCGKTSLAYQWAWGADTNCWTFDLPDELEEGEHDATTFKGSIRARSAVILNAQKLSSTHFLNIMGGALDLDVEIFVVANLDGIPKDHWLRKLATLDFVRHVQLGLKEGDAAMKMSEIAKELRL